MNLPVCAKCQKPVDRIMWAEEPRDLSVVVVVWCHGEREKVVLSASTLRDAFKIAPGYAFQKALP